MKIGLFDSGIGGLTVLHQAMITLPGEEFIYYADTDHVPYGTKPREEIIRYIDEAVRFLIEKEVKAVVIACNTATSVAIDYLRQKYSLPILGMEPAVKPAVQKYGSKRVMVIATPLTVREEKLQNLLRQVDDNHKVDLLALPKLVQFAESGQFDTREVEEYLRQELESYRPEDYSSLILGCTHFNFFKDTLRKIFPEDVAFIDGSVGTVNHLKNILQERGQLENGKSGVEYYMSGRIVTEPEQLKRFAMLHNRLDQMLMI